ncbi:MAG: acetyl-CoA acetyltransferase [Pseudomonadota bacterium]
MALAIDDRLPVIVGAGQVVAHWHGNGPSPDPAGLAATAVERALVDCAGDDVESLRKQIDALLCTRLMRDSLPGLDDPDTRFVDLPSAIASRAGLEVSKRVYSCVGGEQPQSLVYEACCDVFAGRHKCVVVTGAEATSAIKQARRNQQPLNWDLSGSGQSEDRGFGEMIITPYEFSKGLGLPMFSYALIDHALRTRYGWSRDEYRFKVGEFLAGFSAVAAENEFAYFHDRRTADFLTTASDENPLITDPFLKWHMAQDAVNQGAALVVTSVGHARALGIPERRWVFMHSFAQAKDDAVSHRADLSHSRPMQVVLRHALDQANVRVEALATLDLYSCFPSVVLLACEYLGIDPLSRPLTVTGGLPFFGGPGNNYALHAIAATVARCRETPAAAGLVLANGGYLSKLSAAVYSSAAPTSVDRIFRDAISLEDASDSVAIDEVASEASVESFFVAYGRRGPRFGALLSRSDRGRALIQVENAQTLQRLSEVDPIGKPVSEFWSDA